MPRNFWCNKIKVLSKKNYGCSLAVNGSPEAAEGVVAGLGSSIFLLLAVSLRQFWWTRFKRS